MVPRVDYSDFRAFGILFGVLASVFLWTGMFWVIAKLVMRLYH